jgi:hypothetical protein
MKQHPCYYCNQELVKDVVLVTFYTKKCTNCQARYHLDWNNDIKMIVLDCFIRNRRYSVLHHLELNKIKIIERVRLTVDENGDMNMMPKDVAIFDGDYNVINPSNLVQKIKTILTFL